MERKGEPFEVATAETFRLLGYQVERNALIAGSQIDMVLRRSTGVIRELYLVECKDYEDAIGVAAVRSFYAVLEGARRELPGANGIFVSREEPTKEAKAFADSVGIQPVTLRELEARLVDLAPYEHSLIEGSEQAEWARHYVPLRGYRLRDASERHRQEMVESRGPTLAPAMASGSEPPQEMAAPEAGWGRWLKDLDEALEFLKMEDAPAKFPELRRRLADKRPSARPWHVPALDAPFRHSADLQGLAEDWMVKSSASGLLLLGDYGTGKTTFLHHFAALQAQRFLSDPDHHRCPVLLYLKDFPGGLDLRTLLVAVGDLVGDPSLNRNLIERLLRRGRLLLLLDGFDEMGLQADTRMRRVLFSSLLRLMLMPAVKVVVSGRPGYFPSLQEMEEVLELGGAGLSRELEAGPAVEAVAIAALDEGQISRYVDSFDWETSQLTGVRVKEVIGQVYNLRELAERPFLLDLIVKTIPLLEREAENVNPARLYEIYTERWLSREYGKGDFRWLIERSEKRAFTIELAWRMLRQRSLKIHFSELADWVRSYFNVSSPETIDYLAQDIRTCSFLGRDDEGFYSFVHRSFMEYFVALRLLEGIEQGQSLNSLVEGLAADSLTENSVAFTVDMIWRRLASIEKIMELVVPAEYRSDRVIKAFRLIRSLPPKVRQLCKDTLLGSDDLRAHMRIGDDWSGGGSVLGGARRRSNPQPGALLQRVLGRQKLTQKDDDILKCGFCGFNQRQVLTLIKAPTLYICNDCVYEATVRSTFSFIGNKQTAQRCSFCNKMEREAKFFFQSLDDEGFICDECHEVCEDMVITDAEA